MLCQHSCVNRYTAVLRAITGKNDKGKQTASANTMGRFETDQIAEVAIDKRLFSEILSQIERLR